MVIKKSLTKSISRREFLKVTGKACLSCCVGLTCGNLLTGCASAPKETRQEVERIEWECNPIIPMVDGRCYTGTNAQIPIDSYKDWWQENFGISPTFHHPKFARSDGLNDTFPRNRCEKSIQNGVIPVIRYLVMSDIHDIFKPIIKGKADDVIKKFAHQVAQFEHPMVLMPFEQPNSTTRAIKIWSGYPGAQYVDAWVRMHEIFEREGANSNTVWTIKLKFGSWTHFQFPDPFQYIPPKQFVDIIGWMANNVCKPQFGQYNQSLNSMFGSYYNKAAIKYPTKPQMFWEFSSQNNRGQHQWMEQALSDIETKFLRIKGVMLDEVLWRHPTMPSWGEYDVSLTPESTAVVRKHFTSGYYLGSILDTSSKVRH